MSENANGNARQRVVNVVLTEGHVDLLDRFAREDNRNRSQELRALIEEEAARRPATQKNAIAPQAAA